MLIEFGLVTYIILKVNKIKKLSNSKETVKAIAEVLLEQLINMTLDAQRVSAEIKLSDNLNSILEYINVLLLKLSKQNIKYIKCIEIVEETKKRLKANSNYDMCIDYMIFSMSQEVIGNR